MQMDSISTRVYESLGNGHNCSNTAIFGGAAIRCAGEKKDTEAGGLTEPRVPSSLPLYVRRGWLQGGNRPRLIMIGIRLTAHPTDLSL